MIFDNTNLFTKIFIYVFVIFLLLLSSTTIYKYDGSIFYYIFFTLIINIYLLLSFFSKKKFFIDIFLSIFIWLGFWFKFSVIISFVKYKSKDFNLIENFKNFGTEVFDKCLFLSAMVVFLLIICLFFKIIFLRKNYGITKNIQKNYFTDFYINNRFSILIFFISTIILSSLVNYNLNIYLKGKVNLEINTFLLYYMKFFYNIGFIIIISFLTFNEILINKKNINKIFIISTLSICFISTTFLSRNFIIIEFTYLVGLFFLIFYIKNITIPFKQIVYFSTIILVCFVVNIKIVDGIRFNELCVTGSIFCDKEIESDYENLPKESVVKSSIMEFNYFKKKVLYLAIYRWVGIDGVANVINKKEILSSSLFKESLNEKVNYQEYSFYQKKFHDKSKYDSLKAGGVKGDYGIVTPGFVAFFYYTGSLIMVMFLVFIMYFLFSLFEKIALQASSKNIIFSCFIAQLLVYRLIHFGYVPRNTMTFLLAIVISFAIIKILNKITYKKIK